MTATPQLTGLNPTMQPMSPRISTTRAMLMANGIEGEFLDEGTRDPWAS